MLCDEHSFARYTERQEFCQVMKDPYQPSVITSITGIRTLGKTSLTILLKSRAHCKFEKYLEEALDDRLL